jgi:hypothetical protein
MRTEVYLLSVPLARHRNIVPRRRDVALAPDGFHMRPVEQRVSGVRDEISDSSTLTGTFQRIDPR